jgi:hypothetical protein
MNKIELIESYLKEMTTQERKDVLNLLRQRYQIALHPLEDNFGVSAEIILEAIHRGSDLTRRGVRGIIAEAIFEAEIIPKVVGWKSVENRSMSADFTLEDESGKTATIQVKLQRKEKDVVKMAGKNFPDHYIVEIQKTRSGKDKQGKASRPYRFGDFDILAVCLEPSSKNWHDFRYTLSSWLFPRPEDAKLITIMQPIPMKETDRWTNRLETCLDWFRDNN